MLICFAQEPSLQWGCLYGKLIGLQDCSWSNLPLPFWRLKVRTGIAASSLCRLARVGEVQAQYCFPFFVLVQLLNAGDLVDIPYGCSPLQGRPTQGSCMAPCVQGWVFQREIQYFFSSFMPMGSNKWFFFLSPSPGQDQRRLDQSWKPQRCLEPGLLADEGFPINRNRKENCLFQWR